MQDAISAGRCLARLVRLTDWSLLALLWPVALRLARLVAKFRSGPPSTEGMATFEEQLNRLLCEMGRRIVERTLNQLEPKSRDEMPPVLFWKMDAYRPKRLSPTRNLNCLFGPIRVSRWLYESLDELGLPSLFPLEQALGIVAGGATPALANVVAQLSAIFTQRKVLETLRQQHHIVWGVGTLRRVTQ